MEYIIIGLGVGVGIYLLPLVLTITVMTTGVIIGGIANIFK